MSSSGRWSRIQVGAYLGVDARRAFAFPADGLIPSLHAVHIGRRASQIAQITLEVWQLRDGFHLFQNALLAAAYDEFALVCGDGAEGTSSETSAMQVDGELYHVVCRNTFSLVFGWGRRVYGKSKERSSSASVKGG